MTLIETIIQRIAWRERIVWAYMSEHKQREIAYLEIVLLAGTERSKSLDASISFLHYFQLLLSHIKTAWYIE